MRINNKLLLVKFNFKIVEISFPNAKLLFFKVKFSNCLLINILVKTLKKVELSFPIQIEKERRHLKKAKFVIHLEEHVL